MTTRRYYANAAPQLTLNTSATSTATSIAVSGSFAGWPTQFPYYACLEYGTASMEIVSVTSVSGSTATIVRGQDGTANIAHNAGATLDQVVVRQDFDEANAHTSASSGVHGVTGSVVGTTDTQTLSNKTLAAPAITGTVSGGITASGGLSGTTGTFTGAVSTGALTAAGTTVNGQTNMNGPTFIVPQAAGATLSVTNVGNTVTGFTVDDTGKITASDLVLSEGTDLTAAWQSFTPTWTAATTNPTYGNATVACAYKRIGKTVCYRVNITLGSTTNVGAGQPWSFSLPVACSGAFRDGIGGGVVVNGGAVKPIQTVLNTSTTVQIYRVSTEGILGPTGAGSVWATGDVIAFSGTYQTT